MPQKMTETSVSTSKLSVESPMPNERIKSKYCCFMFRSEIDGAVEASIDDGPWLPCRHLMGYWWLDWECAKKGKHDVVARLKSENGHDLKTEPRSFQVL